jgi:hypothetical protein
MAATGPGTIFSTVPRVGFAALFGLLTEVWAGRFAENCEPDCELAHSGPPGRKMRPAGSNDIRGLGGTDAPARTGDPQIHNLVL